MPATTPLVESLPTGLTASDVFQRIANRPGCVFLDSARTHEQLGRYSFVASDPYYVVRVPANRPTRGLALLQRLRARLDADRRPTVPGLPPFQGGAAGLLAYDFHRSLESVPRPRFDEFAVPAAFIGFYDVVFAFDHTRREGWVISQGAPERSPAAQKRRAEARLVEAMSLLRQAPDVSPPTAAPASLDAPRRATEIADVFSCFNKNEYLDMVRRGVRYILDGDVFQVNLAQRLLTVAREPADRLYLRLREINPAPFSCYLNLGDAQVCSASPERLVACRERRVETRPIKGTRRRRLQPEADIYAGAELQASDKDRAENIMIVDLQRNDLSKVCLPESIEVSQLCGLEEYQFVLHLVSVVSGVLRDEADGWDLLGAMFPGGSITGAPKVRAMQIVAELEPVARGAYCGSAGYIGFDGAADFNILIRTLTAADGWWNFPVGGVS